MKRTQMEAQIARAIYQLHDSSISSTSIFLSFFFVRKSSDDETEKKKLKIKKRFINIWKAAAEKKVEEKEKRVKL